VTKHQQNDRKFWKNAGSHPRRPSPNNPCTHRHFWDQLRSLPGDLNRTFEHVLRTFEHVLHCRRVCSPTLGKWSKAAARKGVS
jgi:hypothetical protein